MTLVFSHSTAAGADRLLLLAIADHAGDDGDDAWPSVPTLARKTGISERSVQRGISRLVDGGHLAVTRCAGRNGTNRYRVLMAPPRGRQSVTGDDLTPVTELRHPGGDTQVSPERPVRPSSPLPPKPTASRATRPSRSQGTNPRAVAVASDRQERERAQAAQEAERSARCRAVAHCVRCDSSGYLPGGHVCDHDPETPARVARGMQLVRAELARRSEQPRQPATSPAR